LSDLKIQTDSLIVRCPNCTSRFRLNGGRHSGKRLTLRCRRCGGTFVYRPGLAAEATTVLVAHGEEETGAAIGRAVGALNLSCRLCRDDSELLDALGKVTRPVAVLVDVGLPGAPIHQVVEEIRRRTEGRAIGVVLITSVFRPGAYFRRPVDLFGADDCLDPHRLEEDLPAKLRPFCVDLGESAALSHSPGESQHGAEPEPCKLETKDEKKARELAQVIAADIALLNRDRFEEAVRARAVQDVFSADIHGGENLLRQRLGVHVPDTCGFVRQAFLRLAEQRASELNHS
jgi:predicted Zn finger-like uncharacterized protein